MMRLAPGTQVWLSCRPTDLRKGFNGLAAQVKNVLDADPFSGHLFVFRGKRGDYVKILYWDGTGPVPVRQTAGAGPVCMAAGDRRAAAADAGATGAADRGHGLAADGGDGGAAASVGGMK